MTPPCFELVDPIFQRGLDLKENYKQRPFPNRDDMELRRAVDQIQLELKKLLLDRRWAALGVDDRNLPNLCAPDEVAGGDAFLGIRYALVCWLDEALISDCPPLAPRWNEQKLEHQLYGTNLRAATFLSQAQLAEGRVEGEALEVYFLCAMLGFRGVWRDKPEDWAAWVMRIQPQLPPGNPAGEPCLDPPPPPLDERPLHGRRRYETMTRVWEIILLILAPVVVVVTAYLLSNS